MTSRTRPQDNHMNSQIDSYLAKPYARIVIPAEDGSYFAEILEFPGCFAQGTTAEEAIRNLERAAQSWIEVAQDQGQEIPPPMAVQDYSGKVLLRMPRGIHKQAARYAQRETTSLNQFISAAVAARVGAEEFYDRILTRLEGQLMPVARTILVLPDSAFQAYTHAIASPVSFFPVSAEAIETTSAQRKPIEVTQDA